ncbi:hypothetical protein QBZ16_002367 [Prototheca wickerhamii]|uniref:Uncharacterized protein n=1 Tax=Prototheca wickerhamii TaxID=3111 RepID=A0AAD9INU2_PROWI|nr:hypothetical protein QBZ16_002367 [Prototheca wickerhamii]
MERAKAMTLRGARCGGQSHPRTIKSVQMLALAGIVVTGSYDGTLISWDLASGERLCRPQYHSATVRTLALDEDWCVSGCSDGPSRYDFAARRRTLVEHKGPVSSLCLTRRYLYTYEVLGSWDGSIREVARATGKVRRTFYLGDLVMSMALSGEDRLLVARTCGRNPRALAWSGSGASPRTPVTCLSFSFPFLLVTVRDSAFLVNVARDLGLEKACPLRGAPTSRLLSSAACRAAKLGDGWAAVASGASLDVFDFGRAAELEQARIAARAARKAQRARLVMAGARESTAEQPQVGVHKAAAVSAAVPFLAEVSDVPSAPLPGGFETRFEHHCEPLATEERASDGNDFPSTASEASEPDTTVAPPRADRHAPALATCRSQVARSLKLRKARQQVEALFWDS